MTIEITCELKFKCEPKHKDQNNNDQKSSGSKCKSQDLSSFPTPYPRGCNFELAIADGGQLASTIAYWLFFIHDKSTVKSIFFSDYEYSTLFL